VTSQPPETPKSSDKKPGLATLVLHHSVTFLILVLFLALGVWSYLTFQDTDFFATVDHQAFAEELSPPLVESQRQRLTFAIDVARQLTGRTPSTLNELVEMGFLLESDLYYPGGPDRWVYERLAEGYSLTREPL
jgi:hypothetical protein